MSTDRRLLYRARIACLTSDGALQDALTKTFNDAGFDVTPQGEADMADIGVVDLRERDITAKQASAIASAMRKRSPECAIVYLTDPHLMPKGRAILRHSGEVLPAEDSLAPAVVRCRQILRLRNLAEEAGERLKSLAAMSRLAEFPIIQTSDEAPRVLIAGPPGPSALGAAAAADAVSSEWTGVISAGQSLRAIEAGKFDCAVFLPNRKNDLLHSLGRSVQRSPKHADLPIIHIAEDCDALDALMEKGARDFLLADYIEHDLAHKITNATRRARLAAAMRQFLGACAGDGVSDPASGAFTAAFYAQHGARICARADHTRRPLSLAIFKLNATAARGGDAALDKRALQQASRLTRRLTRGEDLLARLSSEYFALLMPATTQADAENIARRLEGVLANTLFRGASKALFSVNLLFNVTAREPGVCIEEATAAALVGLRERPRAANDAALV